jgi:hypothetical protein
MTGSNLPLDRSNRIQKRGREPSSSPQREMDDERLLRREDQALRASCRSPASRDGGAWPDLEEASETLAGHPLRARARFGWRCGAGSRWRAQRAGEGAERARGTRVRGGVAGGDEDGGVRARAAAVQNGLGLGMNRAPTVMTDGTHASE